MSFSCKAHIRTIADGTYTRIYYWNGSIVGCHRHDDDIRCLRLCVRVYAVLLAAAVVADAGRSLCEIVIYC